MKITYTFTAPDGYADDHLLAAAVSKLMEIMAGALSLKPRGGEIVSRLDYGVRSEDGTSFVCTAIEK